MDRLKSTTFGSAEYAREELVAELTAALTAQRYGMSKHLKDDTAAYLKAWLDSLKESPQFIKTVLLDVKKASSMLTQRIDQIAMEIEEEKKATQMVEGTKGLDADAQSAGAEKFFYASVAYLQTSNDTAGLSVKHSFPIVMTTLWMRTSVQHMRNCSIWRSIRKKRDWRKTKSNPLSEDESSIY